MIYFLINRQSSFLPSLDPNQTNLTPTSTVSPNTAFDEFLTPQSDADVLKAGGSSYSDPKGLYVFLYPNEYTLDTQDPVHPRIYKQGEQQRPQSEMSDGVIIVFETVDLQGKTLEAWVDERIKQSTADGTTEVEKPKQSLTLNTYTGFTFDLRGLGTSTNIVIQKTPQSPQALLVTYMVADPKNLNYQSEVDAVLATIELLK